MKLKRQPGSLGVLLALTGVLAAAAPSDEEGKKLAVLVENTLTQVSNPVLEYFIDAREFEPLLGRPIEQVADFEVWEVDKGGKRLSQKASQTDKVAEGVGLSWSMDGATPAGEQRRFELVPLASRKGAAARGLGVQILEEKESVRVQSPWYEIVFDLKQGGRITNVVFKEAGRDLKLEMCDGVGISPQGDGANPQRQNTPIDGGEVDARQIGKEKSAPARKLELQQWRLPKAGGRPEVAVTEGPLRSTLEIRTGFPAPGKQPPFKVVYRYAFYSHAPMVKVEVHVPAQSVEGSVQAWGLFEFRFPEAGSFTRWACGEPPTGDAMTTSGKNDSIPLGGGGRSSEWAAFVGERFSFALIGSDLGVLDHRADNPRFAGATRSPWRGGPWNGEPFRWEATWYLGSPGEGGKAISDLAKAIKSPVLHVQNPAFAERMARIVAQARELAEQAARLKDPGAARALTAAEAVGRMLAQAAQERVAKGTQIAVAHELAAWAEEIFAGVTKALRGKETLPPAPTLFQRGARVAVANDSMALLFDRGRLESIFHNARAHAFLRFAAPASPLWGVRVKEVASGRMRRVTDANQQGPVAFDAGREADGSLRLRWEWGRVDGGDAPAALKVGVTGKMPPSGGMSAWRIEVNNPSPKLGLWEVEFPVVGNLGKTRGGAGSDYFALPFKSGVLLENPARGAGLDDQREGMYGVVGMQVFPYWYQGSGLYLGTRDPDGWVKRYGIKSVDGKVVEYRNYHPVPNVGAPATGFSLPYDCALGVFEGDWYDAAKIYRQWALHQKWCPKKTLAANDDVPRWFRESHLTFRPGAAPAEAVSIAENLASAFKMPGMVNWYDWTQQEQIEENWPDMSPPKDGFREAVARLKGRGMRVVPYMMSIMWDERTPSYAKDGAEKAAVRQEDGTIKYIRYHDNPLVTMCPYTKLWQEKCKETVGKMLDAGDISGMYMDLASTAVYLPCYAANHGHPAGGGTYGVEGMRALLRGMRQTARKRNPEFVMLAEGRWECMIDLEDSHLLFHTVRETLTPVNLPMFEAVYGDYIRPYGAKTAGIRGKPVEAIMPAQSFTFGSRLGRFFGDAMVADGSPQFGIYLRMAEYRQTLAPWLAYGEMLRPLAIRYESESKTALQEKGLAIWTSSWKAADGTVAFVFVNATLDSTIRFAFRIDPKEYGVKADGSWNLVRVTPAGLTKLAPVRGLVERAESLPGGEVLALLARPSP